MPDKPIKTFVAQFKGRRIGLPKSYVTEYMRLNIDCRYSSQVRPTVERDYEEITKFKILP